MSKMIQVRNVSDETHRILKTRAVAAGMSLSDYIKRDLEEAASHPTIDEFEAEFRARVPHSPGLTKEAILESLRQVRDP